MKIGSIHIARAVDLAPAAIPASRGFPSLTRAMLAAHAARLGPAHIDPHTLDLIISLHSWIVRLGDLVVLVDTCIGNDKDRPERPLWHHRQGDYLQRIEAFGVRADEVDVVMCTHLHADHVGWNTRRENGRWVPTFPKARYVMADAEYRHWHARHLREGPGLNHGSFEDSVLPVVEAGQAELVSMTHRVASGMHIEPAPGHTPGGVTIHVEDDGAHGVFCGDIIHHPIVLADPGMHTNYCEDPVQSARTRVAFCERFADTGTRILTAHFAAPSSGRIRREGRAFDFLFDEE